MDLIGMLGSQLGIDGAKAQALAGSVLGGVKGAVASELGDESAQKIDAAIPELGGWQDQAKSALGEASSDGGGLLGGLGDALGGSGGLLGGAMNMVAGAEQASALTGILTKFGLDSSVAGTVGPLVLQFLKSRIDADLMQKITSAVPMLAAFTGGEGESSGVGSLLGGLLG